MRSFILVVVTAFVLSVGGLIYFWTQVTHKHGSSAKREFTTTRPAIRNVTNGIGISDGDHVSVKKYDQRTGELSSEFYSEQYTPRRGGLVDVKNAVARFYLTKQIIELRGDTGTFRTDTPQEGKRNKNMAESRAATPNRGQMQKVTVTIIDVIGDKAHPTTQPSTVITMPNAAFDSENGTIVTEAYKDPATGQVIPAEEVPVKVRSPDTNPNGYDFDGRGMKMLWNDRDHRLTSLDIIHGERLIIKNPKKVTEPKTTPANPPHVAQTPVSLLRPIPGSAIASADKNAVYLVEDTEPARRVRRRRHPTTAPTTQQSITAEEPATQPVARRTRRRGTYTEPPLVVPKLSTNTQPPIYRAEFHDHVRIVQNGDELATADRMFVDFWMQNGDEDNATTKPSGTPQSTGRRRPTSRPTTRTASTQPTTKPLASATTRPDEAPIYIYWTGPLHVAPHADVALISTEKIVTLEGNPVHGRKLSETDRKNVSEIFASRLIYKTEDGSVKATPLTEEPVKLLSTDSKGLSTILTSDLEYFSYMDPPTAVLSGPSSAELPQADGALLKTKWDRRCTLRFANQEQGGDNSIKEADITGNVHVDHPQMKLDSQRLELAFAEPPAATKVAKKKAAQSGAQSEPMQASLKQLVASDNVHCIMIDKEKKQQTIDTDRLTLLTEADAEGKLVPRTVNADGSVHAVDEQQDLRTDHLAMTLAATQPSTRPSRKAQASAKDSPSSKPSSSDDLADSNVDLQSMIAEGNVKVIGKGDHTQAFADTMLVDKTGGKTTVKLVGGPPGAKVVQKNNTVIGPIINIAKEDQTMAVEGAGEMIGTQVQREGEAPKPMDVTWVRNMRADGKANVVYIYGDVQAKTRETDGSIRTVSGQRAQLLLADKPTTRPSKKSATQPAEAAVATLKKEPTTKKSDDAMPDKDIRQAIFYDDARVKSELLDPQGLIVQRMNMWSSELHYDVIPPDPKTARPTDEPDKVITVPVPGKMLVEDYSAPTTQPAKTQDNGASPFGSGTSGRGATAFQWQKSMVYDDTISRVNMDGSVVIDHRDLDAKKGELEEDSMHITGEHLVADIETPSEAAARTAAMLKAATQPTTKPVTPQRQMKMVVVKDNVRVTMKNGELTADHVTYNPQTKVLIAYGTPERDAVFMRSEAAATQKVSEKTAYAGMQPIRAQVLQWDAGADLPKIIQGGGTMRR